MAIRIAQCILNVSNPDKLSSLIMTGIIKREPNLPRVSFDLHIYIVISTQVFAQACVYMYTHTQIRDKILSS